MATAKVQVTVIYEYDAEYDANGVVYDENERLSNEAQATLREMVGSSVDIVKGGTKVVENAKVTSGGVSVVTVP